MRTVGLALVVAVLSVPGGTSQAADGETCQGKSATIVQDEGLVEGTDGDDVIVATDTRVRAYGGDDTICVTGGKVYGGAGVDSVRMRGTDGVDLVLIRGGEALDIRLGGGNDVVRLIWPRRVDGSGIVDGGSGNDAIDVVTLWRLSIDLRRGELVPGAQGAAYELADLERAFGMSEWADVRGDGGDNVLGALACRGGVTGYAGDDDIYVFEPNGALSQRCAKLELEAFGSAGDDFLSGSPGRDRLIGGPGRDSADGGANVDVCVAEKEWSCER